ncbi:MAG TPA: four helix bundle protein [Candidatus Paceibacterota bacterium]
MNKNEQNKNSFQEAPIIFQLSVLYENSHQLIHSFPKHERYSLGEKIERLILECLELAISANIATKYERENYLIRLGAKIDALKIIFRLALKAEFIEFTKYLGIEKLLLEIGKMAGGWIRFCRNNS